MMFFKSKFVLALFLVLYSFSATANVSDASAVTDAKSDNLPDGAVKLPSGLIVPPPRDQSGRDPLYVRWEMIRNKLFFLDYYSARDLDQKKKKGWSTTDTFMQIRQWINALNVITAKAMESDENQEENIAAYEKYFESVCLECIFEELTKDAEYPAVGTRVSSECESILKNKDFLNGEDSIFYANGPIRYIFWTTAQGSYPFVSALRAEPDPADNPVVPLRAMPFYWIGKPRFFRHYGQLYYADSDYEDTDFAVFEFDTAAGIFKDACRFTSAVTGWVPEKGKDNPVCQAVADKKYQTRETAPMTSVIPAEEYQKFKTTTCLRAKENPEIAALRKDSLSTVDCSNADNSTGYFLASETTGTGVGLKIDYNNDGKDEILTGARYDSGSGAGCSHTLFRIYVSPDAPTRLITNGEPNGIYFHGGNTKDGYEISCNKGYQEIVTVEGKNYLLTADKTGPQRLDEITTLPDGTNKIEQLCSFIPEMGYQ